jgi:hypothetical protein
MDRYYISRKRFITLRKEGLDMAIMAKPLNSIIMIDKDKTDKFLEDSKKNIIHPAFLKECLKITAMAKEDKKQG